MFGAAHLQARFPIAFADAFAASATIDHQVILVTGDPEFKTLEGMVMIERLAR